MPELPLYIKQSVNEYKPIEIDGLTFYPIKVREYEAFTIARSGIEVLQQAMPLSMASLPLLSALHKLDYDAVAKEQAPTGLFAKCLLFLALSLRLGEGKSIDDRLHKFMLVTDPSDPSKLKSIRFRFSDGEQHDITPVQFARYRPILAAQNGIKLESDQANPELVEAEREMMTAKAPKLDVEVESLVSTVAALSHIDDSVIYGWTILQLERRREALGRVIDYIVCGINEGNGCSWKNGNPVPSIWFNRTNDGLGALIKMDNSAASAIKSNE